MAVTQATTTTTVIRMPNIPKFELPRLKGKGSFGFVDLLAYIGGIWFFFSFILIGPLVRHMVNNPLFIAEMGKTLFFRTSEDDFNSNNRVKIRSAMENSEHFTAIVKDMLENKEEIMAEHRRQIELMEELEKERKTKKDKER